LIQRLAAIAARHPDKPFILDPSGVVPDLSFGETLTRAEYFAAAFAARGVRPGSVIALMLPTHPGGNRDAAPAFFGAMMLGAYPAFFPPLTPKQDPAIFWSSHGTLFQRIDVALIISDAYNIGLIADHLPGFSQRCFDAAAAQPVALNFERHPAAPGDTAFLQHSSGTTGLKKGVMLSHKAVLDHVDAMAEALALTGDDRLVSWLPLYHDMGLIGCLVMPALLGLTVISLDPFAWLRRPALLLEAITAHRATITWQPNFAFHLLMRAAGPAADYDLSSLRAIIDCSEPCKAETLAAFRAHFAAASLAAPACQVSYAMAENVFMVTATPLDRPPRCLAIDTGIFINEARAVPSLDAAAMTVISCGPPIAGVKLRILGADGATLADGQVGEIAFHGPTLFNGYYRIETPAEKWHKGDTQNNIRGWYRTGDLGFLDAGELFVTGRKDDLMIIHGKNIYAHDVEYTINSHCAVKPGRAAAVGPFNPQAGSQALVALVEAETADPAARAALTLAIKNAVNAEYSLALYEVMIVDPGWLVKTTSGKISRKENLARYCALRPHLRAAA
jgi:acyl-CoA synthetase (AMP-forming)/AMP-acid ligase II